METGMTYEELYAIRDEISEIERQKLNAFFKQWTIEAREAVTTFLQWCKDVEVTAESGHDVMTVAKRESAKLRQRLMQLERKIP